MRTGNLNSLEMANASSNSRRGRLGESAITASDLSPSTSRATNARNTESTPPEYATRQEPYSRSKDLSRSSFSDRITQKWHWRPPMSSRRMMAQPGGALRLAAHDG